MSNFLVTGTNPDDYEESKRDQLEPREYAIGLYDENRKLVGHKTDSFWSLSKKYFKPTKLENGEIPSAMIKNLKSMLTTNGQGPIGILQAATKNKYYQAFDSLLLGYCFGDEQPTITHRVFEKDVQPLDAEDLERFNPKPTSQIAGVDW